MKTGLKPGEVCPLHSRRDCCGRSEFHRYRQKPHQLGKKYRVAPGVYRITDLSNPRGYREMCSKSVLKSRKDTLIRRDPTCWLCGEGFTEYDEIELEHKDPKGMNGSRRDDSWGNLALSHKVCNAEKGSKRVALSREGKPLNECAENLGCIGVSQDNCSHDDSGSD